jgi:peptidoglycan-associated lipoprotein
MKILKARSSLLLLLPAFLFVACGTPPPPPSPEDTLSQGAAPQGADWIDPTQLYGPGAEGLEMRDSGMGAGGSGRIENILEPVYFEFDTSYVQASERPKLQAAAEHLQRFTSDRLLVEGHCDWRGTKEYNLALGDRRATSVKRYLVQLGVAEGRIETVSFGDLRATENASDDQMKRERRTDLVIVR